MKIKKLIVYFLLLGCMSSCNEMMDCILSVEPELPSKVLAEGKVGTPYSDYLLASVKNDPHDGDYIYYFNVSGSLPDGIEAWVNNRTLTFEGTPTTAGHYTFKVRLEIEPLYIDEDGSDNICFGDDTIERSYSIRIWEE